jgi:predicted DNA-binding protein YlxM (UPF0122 family)
MDIDKIRDEIRKTKKKLFDLEQKLEVAEEEEREQRRADRERDRWLAEFTARQAHYHSR